ncbi:mCG1040646, isoform CRA_a, partial [Mus musculus]
PKRDLPASCGLRLSFPNTTNSPPHTALPATLNPETTRPKSHLEDFTTVSVVVRRAESRTQEPEDNVRTPWNWSYRQFLGLELISRSLEVSALTG